MARRRDRFTPQPDAFQSMSAACITTVKACCAMPMAHETFLTTWTRDMKEEELTAIVDKLWDAIEPEARVSSIGHVILIVVNPDASTSIMKQGGRLPQHVVGDT